MSVQNKNLRRYKAAVVDKGAIDLYLVPCFSDTTVTLHYQKGKLVKTRLPAAISVLKASGVRPVFRTQHFGLHNQDFEIHGHLQDQLFIARGLRSKRKITRALQLQMLHALGFLTPISLCSWLAVIGVDKKGNPITRDLPLTRKGATRALELRKARVQKVLDGQRASYWQTENQKGQRKLGVSHIVDLEVAQAVYGG